VASLFEPYHHPHHTYGTSRPLTTAPGGTESPACQTVHATLV